MMALETRNGRAHESGISMSHSSMSLSTANTLDPESTDRCLTKYLTGFFSLFKRDGLESCPSLRFLSEGDASE
jgi:hypothetical protein